MPAEIITMPEVLKLLGISRTQLYNLRRQGKIAPVNQPTEAKRKPSRVLFRREDAERLARPIAQAS